ncbi:MAG: HNH endonuclease [Lachnospiraceae bacterium]|nr:HNH endonuclease [Lachnospiraceae bacterium]
MKRLEIPLRDVEERTIYQKCADDFEDKTALGYIDQVVASADEYEAFVPQNVAGLTVYTINPGDKKKIKKVYTQKFAKKGSIGKDYYEAIMLNANGRCPICGDGKPKNLDHFLPKSKYPLLCVTPANLVPVCRDCNIDKGDEFDTNYYLLPFNPYFDEMNETWLECNICFKGDGTYELNFGNGYDENADHNKWQKYETHLRVFDLNATFTAKALEEVDNCKYQFQELLKECGLEAVKKDLTGRKNSYEHNDVNSWRSALYRELVRKVNDFCHWLE